MMATRRRQSAWTNRAYAALAVLLAGAAAGADTVQLRRAAQVTEADVRLRDVAQLRGDAAVALGDVKLASIDKPGATAKVALGAVRRALDERGVNWARVSLTGYAACRVDREGAKVARKGRPKPKTAPQDSTPAPATAIAKAQPVVTNPTQEISVDTPITLRARVTEMLTEFAGGEPATLAISFSSRDHEALNESVLGDRLAFEPVSRGALGRVPVVIRRYRDDELVKTYRLTAEVSRRVLVVKTTRGLTRGALLTADDVELQEAVLTSANDQPLTDIKAVVGRVSTATLRAGVTLTPRHVRTAWAAERGDLITVRCLAGGLVIKTIGRALDDGAANDFIEVRNERTRQTFTVRLTGPKQGVLAIEPSAQAVGAPVHVNTQPTRKGRS